MDTPRALVLAALLGWPAAALCDTCPELHESCVEDCRIDHGMDKDRTRLEKCVTRCATRKEDCWEMQREDRENYHRSKEAPPPERKAPPSDVRPVEESQTGEARPMEPEEEDPGRDERRRRRRQREENADAAGDPGGATPPRAAKKPAPPDEESAPEAKKPKPKAEEKSGESLDRKTDLGAHEEFDRGGE